jgi:3-hydroxy-9,10-secoandrosta-1,3,5(10)-triene-9,17-dione monooxygenase reductase component
MLDENLIKTFDTMRSGVYIVTSSYRRKPGGCTAVWVCRASFTPPLVAVHLAPFGHTLQTIERGKRFCINVVGDSGLTVARNFGFKSGHSSEKFKDVPYTLSPGGSPILDVAVSYIDCKLTSMSLTGDHNMVIGKVLGAAITSTDAPLIYDPATFYIPPAERVESVGRKVEQL